MFVFRFSRSASLFLILIHARCKNHESYCKNTSNDDASGEKASGNDASGYDASGEYASGEEASGK